MGICFILTILVQRQAGNDGLILEYLREHQAFSFY